MESSFMKDAQGAKLYKNATDLVNKGNHIKALEIFEDVLSVHRQAKDSWLLHIDQGKIFLEFAETAEDPDMEIAYLLGSVACFSESVRLSELCAQALHLLAKKIGSVLYYKKCVYKAKEGLFETYADNVIAASPASHRDLINQKKKGLESLLKDAQFKIAASKISPLQISEPKLRESKKCPEPSDDDFKGLRSFWMGLDVNIRRDFMKVSVAKLITFVEGVHKRKGRDVLKEVLASVRESRRWTSWWCRTKCSEKLSTAEDFLKHLEQKHAAECKPSSEKEIVKRIGKDWARKMSIGSWEPVDAVAAVEMIKNQLADVKAFASKSKNGWSKEWPLAADEERCKLLKEIKGLLVSLCDHEILSRSIRDWVMFFPVKHLEKLEVSGQSLTDSHLADTPQSICFLECHELNQILDFLKTIKCERNDGTDLVCRGVESFLGRTRVKERIDFDPEFSFLLLDRRLLKTNNAPPLDDEGTINVFDPTVHYAKAHAQGDDIISWLTDYNSVDKTFPRPIREYNPDIWVAVLRAVQFTCRTLRAKYAKKVQAFDYDAALSAIIYFCLNEDERRKNLQESQWNRYASLLCDNCEERVLRNSSTSKLFLCAVRDVLKGASHPSFDLPSFEDCMNLIREHKSLSDDKVLKSIELLQSVVTHKVLRIDSKILLIDNSRISLLNNLTRLSVFDNRTYILQLLKPFLLNEIMNMESNVKSAAAEAKADLLLKKEEKSQAKKMKNRSRKRPSSSKSCPLDKTVEHESPVNLEPESTSPALKTVEEDSMEPEAAFANERSRLEISSNTEHQEEATEDDPGMQNMPGEDSLSAHLEPASARYNSALDMTVKALLNINVLKEDLMNNRQPFQDHLEEQVPSALKNLFTAFVSEVIKNEGVYSGLLSDLLASLEEVLPMSSDAAKVVVAILEFWRCWKNAERESLVTCLFTLVENERMSCRKCRRVTNYPEQSSDVIVMAADAIRDLKCALGSIKFVDILKVIRMEYQKSCDIKTGGCGKRNFVHHTINRSPSILTIVLEWEKIETENEISETTKALEWEIDISRLYEGLEANTKYRLVSMVGCGEEEEEDAHICIAYEKNRWVNLRRESLAGEDVGNWKSVVGFCRERKIRPEILLYEALR